MEDVVIVLLFFVSIYIVFRSELPFWFWCGWVLTVAVVTSERRDQMAEWGKALLQWIDSEDEMKESQTLRKNEWGSEDDWELTGIH